MNDISKTIKWADKSWNPITGCSPASEGCNNCYAHAMAKRFNGGDFSVKFHPERLDELRRKKRWTGRVFVCSTSDFFHRDVKLEWQVKVFDAIFSNSLVLNKYLFLTKRPENIGSAFPGFMNDNIWVGVSVENQAMAEKRIPLLQKAPVAHRFLSIEPMLGPIYLSSGLLAGIEWVICGPETGRGKRPCKLEWIQEIYSKCYRHRIAFWDNSDHWILRVWPEGLR